MLFHKRLERSRDFIVDDDRLLRSADHTVIERLGVDDRVYGVDDIRRRINNSGSVARAYAEYIFNEIYAK